MFEFRFQEKTIFFILISAIIGCFLISVSLFSFLYYEDLEFWQMSSACMINQDFQCLLEALAHQSIINTKVSNFIICILSINGIFASFVFIAIFKKGAN